MTERVYNGYSAKAQQKCLAHLRRHFKKVVKLGLVFNPALGQEFLDLIDEAFARHCCLARNPGCESLSNLDRGERNRGSPRAFSNGLVALDTRRVSYCDRYGSAPHSGGTSKGLPEVPPDNNQAERSLRLAVTKRKVGGGSRSMQRFAQTADSQSCGADLSAAGAVGHGVF